MHRFQAFVTGKVTRAQGTFKRKLKKRRDPSTHEIFVTRHVLYHCVMSPNSFSYLLSLQAEVRPVREHRAHDRLQLRAGARLRRALAQPHLPRVGRGRAGEAAAAVEAVHARHRRHHLRRRLVRVQRPHGGGQARASQDHEDHRQHRSPFAGK